MKGHDRSRRIAEFLRSLKEDAADTSRRSPLVAIADALGHRGGRHGIDSTEPLTTGDANRKPVDAEVGQVWRVTDPRRQNADCLVALTRVSDEVVRGVVAIEAPWLAGHEDIIASPDQSPTGEALVLCTWSDTPLPRAAFASFIGDLDPEVVFPLQMLLQHRMTGGFHMRARRTSSFEGAPVVVREVWSPATPTDRRSFVTGARIIEPKDARAEAQAFLAETTAWLGDAALEDLWSKLGAPERLGFAARFVKECKRAAGVLLPDPSPKTQDTNPALLLDYSQVLMCREMHAGRSFRLGSVSGLLGSGVAAVLGALANKVLPRPSGVGRVEKKRRQRSEIPQMRGPQGEAKAARSASVSEAVASRRQPLHAQQQASGNAIRPDPGSPQKAELGQVLRFGIAVGQVDADVVVDATRRQVLVVTVRASLTGNPVPGLDIVLRLKPPARLLEFKRMTDRRGLAKLRIPLVGVNAATQGELILSTGDSQRTIEF